MGRRDVRTQTCEAVSLGVTASFLFGRCLATGSGEPSSRRVLDQPDQRLRESRRAEQISGATQRNRAARGPARWGSGDGVRAGETSLSANRVRLPLISVKSPKKVVD